MRLIFTLFFISLIFPLGVQAAPKKKILYKKYTELDFSGQAVQGKIRAPEVFYIFQRKRSGGHQVLQTPTNLDHHQEATLQAIRGAIPK